MTGKNFIQFIIWRIFNLELRSIIINKLLIIFFTKWMTLSYSEVKAVNKTENSTCSLDVMRILYWYSQVQMKNIKNIWNQSQDFGIYRH